MELGQTLSFAARSGLIWPLAEKPLFFSDRFQLGGPSSVRMFRMNCMGPRDGGTRSIPNAFLHPLIYILQWTR